MKRRGLFYLFGLLALGGFVWGLIQLFELRFARGDVYSAYSSLRSDPLGTKVFYESLMRLDQFRVSRNEMALDQLPAGGNTTLFYIGATNLFWSEKTTRKIEKFVKTGGRLVISFYPQGEETDFFEKEKPKASPTPSPTATATPVEETPSEKFSRARDLAKRWEFKFGVKAKLLSEMARPQAESSLDREISWHSALHFKESGPVWKTIYTASECPVVIERPLGDGTIVLASDSYLFSNEAMRHERHPAFLAWLLGGNRVVLFDETHLGVFEHPGVSTLMRRYHLGGLIAGLALLAVLAVWKNAARLVPLTESAHTGEEIVAGKDSFGGFVNLLRRNVGPAQLLDVCVQEWSKFLPRRGSKGQEKISRAQSAIENSKQSKRRDLVRAYQEVSHAVTETKWKQRI